VSWPDAEVVITSDLVTDLVRAQFPELTNLTCRHIDDGFDNSLWRLGDELVVRLPRRSMAVMTVENEISWLDVVARNVQLRTPLPLRVGRPSSDFPWPWSITSWIEGEAGDLIDASVRGRSAHSMGSFLKDIHTPSPDNAPFNEFRSVALNERTETIASRLDELGDHLDVPVLRELWSTCIGYPVPTVPLWIHGDFHPGNTVYFKDKIVGVIDFGDLCAGDCATDLAGGLLALPFETLDEFFDAYGRPDPETMWRTIGWAMLLGTMMFSLGLTDRESYLSIGQLALDNLVRLANEL
jgi:aminoglycoside phosphotransferase (APT) family kinase protein